MAIQPIDLQTMYSQMANVAQNVARAQEGPQLTEAMQQQNVVQKNKEQAEKVQRTSADGAKSAPVRDEGQSGTSAGPSGGKQRRQQNDGEQDDKSADTGIREAYLGQHINITR